MIVEENPPVVEYPVVPGERAAIITVDAAGEVETIDEAVAGIGTSVVRTFIPALIGFVASILVGYAASKGWDVSAAQVTGYVTPFIITGYYAGVRWLEVNVNPAFGKLLGKASQPVYAA